MNLKLLVRQMWMITMAGIDMDKFEVFAKRCHIANDGCMYIRIGEYKDPMKLTDFLGEGYRNSQPSPEEILQLLKASAGGDDVDES